MSSLIVMFSFLFLKIYHGRQEDWIRHGQKYYWFSSEKLDWEQARLYCDENNSRLAIVATTEQHNFLREKILDDMEPDVMAYWIGARYDEGYGVHRWLDGTGMTVKGWGFGRPGTVKGCVDYLDNIGWLWNSHWNCTGDTANFICERSANYTDEAHTDSMNSTCEHIQQHSITLLAAVCVLGGLVLIAVVVGITFIYWRCKVVQNRKTKSTPKDTSVGNIDRYEDLSPTRDQNLQMYETIQEEKDVQYTYI